MNMNMNRTESSLMIAKELKIQNAFRLYEIESKRNEEKAYKELKKGLEKIEKDFDSYISQAYENELERESKTEKMVEKIGNKIMEGVLSLDKINESVGNVAHHIYGVDYEIRQCGESLNETKRILERKFEENY